MMALSGVLQLVRHVGQEFGLGAVGGLGALGLAHVFLVEVDELLAALLLGAARQAEVVDRRHQPPLAVDQLLLVLLQLRDVGADRDGAAVARLQLVDLQPAPVRQLPLEGGAARAVGVGEPAFRRERLHALLDRLARRARCDVAFPETVVLQELRVAHHQPVGGVPQHEGFRGVLDRGPAAACRRLPSAAPGAVAR